MLTRNIKFKNFKLKSKNLKFKKDLKILLSKKNELFKSLTSSYDYSYSNKLVYKLKKYSSLRVIGMGGSILGTEAIYDFLKHKIKKTYWFIMKSSYEGGFSPQVEENIIDVKWIQKNEIPALLENSYKNIKRLIKNNLEF